MQAASCSKWSSRHWLCDRCPFIYDHSILCWSFTSAVRRVFSPLFLIVAKRTAYRPFIDLRAFVHRYDSSVLPAEYKYYIAHDLPDDALKRRVAIEIQRAFISDDMIGYKPTAVIVVTWSNVTFYGGTSSLVSSLL